LSSSSAITPLLASLNAAAASFQRGNFTAGEHQLEAFENKTLGQVGHSNPDLADSLITTAELITAAIQSHDSGNCDQL